MDSAAIHIKLITPNTNRSAISSQQQPVQYAPWRNHMTNAPANPARQSFSRTLHGDRHRARQAFFSGVN